MGGHTNTSTTSATGRWTSGRIAIWTAVALLGAVAWAILALVRGESVNAVWMIVAALCSYAIAYRFYARFIANRVLGVDDSRATPAERLDNDVDFQPTDRRVLFGHHFAAIAGAGPLGGPVLVLETSAIGSGCCWPRSCSAASSTTPAWPRRSPSRPRPWSSAWSSTGSRPRCCRCGCCSPPATTSRPS